MPQNFLGSRRSCWLRPQTPGRLRRKNEAGGSARPPLGLRPRHRRLRRKNVDGAPPQTPAGAPPQTPFRRGSGDGARSGVWAEPQRVSGGGAPSNRKLSCFATGGQRSEPSIGVFLRLRDATRRSAVLYVCGTRKARDTLSSFKQA